MPSVYRNCLKENAKSNVVSTGLVNRILLSLLSWLVIIKLKMLFYNFGIELPIIQPYYESSEGVTKFLLLE
jgi:hypothetical protein